jgi:hypothetical protein
VAEAVCDANILPFLLAHSAFHDIDHQSGDKVTLRDLILLRIAL